MKKSLRLVPLALALAMLLCLLSGCNSSDYKKADELLANNQFEEAITAFEALAAKDYKDAGEKLKQSKYAYANFFAANDRYDEAFEMFAQLGDYEKSASLAAECSARILNEAQKGDYVYYGVYEQDGNEANGKEPIRWLVLGRDGNRVLLLSEYVLDVMRFGTSCYWATSEIREWLNGDFLQNSFSAEEAKYIQNMITSTDTEDRVFLLSAEEARGLFANDESRVAYPTKAVQDSEYLISSTGTVSWWTRSVSQALNGQGVVPVEPLGDVRSAGCAEDAPNEYSHYVIGPRPAICLFLDGVTDEAENMLIFGVDSNNGLNNEPRIYGSLPSSGGSGGSGGSGKCPVCNGTGYVRYYYGSSDLEAWLSGHDAYTTGPCTSGGGTGRGS